MRQFRRPSTYGLLILGLLGAGAVLRWHNIGDSSLWLDELSQVTVGRADGAQFLEGVRSHTAAAPLDYLGTKLTLALLGFSTEWARAWPFAVGVVTILLVERLTLELTGSRRAAVCAAALMVPAGFMVFYSQEARFYASAAAAAAAGLWAFARAERLGRWRDWAVLALVSTLGLYTHYFFGILFAVLAAALVAGEVAAWLRGGITADAMRRHLRRILPMTAVSAFVGLAFLPWYLYAARSQLATVYDYPAIPRLDIEHLWRTLLVLISAVPRVPAVVGDAMSDAPLLTTVLVLAVLGAWHVARRRPVVAGGLISFMVLLVPFVWAADQRAQYFVSERQFIVLVPPLLLLAGTGATVMLDGAARLARRGRTDGASVRRGVVAEAAVAALLAIGLIVASIAPLSRVYAGEFRPREDWRAASAFVATNVCPGGHVFSNIGPGYGFGVGIYAPDLEDRLVYLHERDVNEWLIDVIDRYPITTHDIIVVFRDRPGVFVPGRGTIDTISDLLAGRGFGYWRFTPRIRVFVPFDGCPTSNSAP